MHALRSHFLRAWLRGMSSQLEGAESARIVLYICIKIICCICAPFALVLVFVFQLVSVLFLFSRLPCWLVLGARVSPPEESSSDMSAFRASRMLLGAHAAKPAGSRGKPAEASRVARARNEPNPPLAVSLLLPALLESLMGVRT